MDEHPLDEAQGYAALIELQLDTYPIVEAIQKMVAEVTGESAARRSTARPTYLCAVFAKKGCDRRAVGLSGLPV